MPSILATKADYVEDDGQREYLLLAAYEEADRRGDKRNLTWVASSLASLYVEDLQKPDEGESWIERLRDLVATCPEAGEQTELERLEAILRGRGGHRTSASS